MVYWIFNVQTVKQILFIIQNLKKNNFTIYTYKILRYNSPPEILYFMDATQLLTSSAYLISINLKLLAPMWSPMIASCELLLYQHFNKREILKQNHICINAQCKYSYHILHLKSIFSNHHKDHCTSTS
jgi:hypothetical protein